MKSKKKIFTFVALMGIAMVVVAILQLTPGGGQPDGSSEEFTSKGDPGHNEHGEEKTILLKEEELEEFGIEVETAGPGNIKISIPLPGEVKANADRLAHIVPRFPGIVKEVRKRLGDPVKKGEVLAIIESNESLSPYEVKSLIEGVVIFKEIALGEAIGDDSDIYIIADLDSVWIDLSVYPKDLPFIHIGQSVTISGGPGIPEALGRISYVSPTIDEESRIALARVVIPNPEGDWRPGHFVTSQIVIEETSVPLLVPKMALQTIEGETVLFIQMEVGDPERSRREGFKPKPVIIGRSNKSHVEIIEGLLPGDRYVAKGGFTLKAELSKSSFGEHGH